MPTLLYTTCWFLYSFPNFIINIRLKIAAETLTDLYGILVTFFEPISVWICIYSVRRSFGFSFGGGGKDLDFIAPGHYRTSYATGCQRKTSVLRLYIDIVTFNAETNNAEQVVTYVTEFEHWFSYSLTLHRKVTITRKKNPIEVEW